MDFKRQFGVEIEHGNRNGYVVVRDKLAAKFPNWDNTGSDGSGVEVRSPILKGQGGLDELGEVMEYLKEIGGYLTKNDGMHVHHDASDFVRKGTDPHFGDDDYAYYPSRQPQPVQRPTQASIRVMRVLESYMENQRIIDRLVDPYRRGWAQVPKANLGEWKRKGVVATGRYNVHYANNHGTFEFRQFEGCLDPAKAFAWIEFGQHFLNYTKELTRPASCAATAKHLLDRIGCTANTRKQLLTRPRRSLMPDKQPEDAPPPYFGDYAAVRKALGIKTPYVERGV